jgi:hypothetical protein
MIATVIPADHAPRIARGRRSRTPARSSDPFRLYAAWKGTTLSFAARRNRASACALASVVLGALGLRFAARRLVCFGWRPERPVQIAMKATRSSAAGSSHVGAWRGLSVVALLSAESSSSRFAASTSAFAAASAASLARQSGPHFFRPLALLASALAFASSASALVLLGHGTQHCEEHCARLAHRL